MKMKKKEPLIDAAVPEGLAAIKVGTVLPASSVQKRNWRLNNSWEMTARSLAMKSIICNWEYVAVKEASLYVDFF